METVIKVLKIIATGVLVLVFLVYLGVYSCTKAIQTAIKQDMGIPPEQSYTIKDGKITIQSRHTKTPTGYKTKIVLTEDMMTHLPALNDHSNDMTAYGRNSLTKTDRSRYTESVTLESNGRAAITLQYDRQVPEDIFIYDGQEIHVRYTQ